MEHKNTTEEKLQEIIYKNWKNGDEVGLFNEVKALLQKQKEEIIRRIQSVKEAVQEQTGAFKYDDCYDDCIRIIKELE